MGLFPTDAEDGTEVTNTGGTTFKYVAVDDKWIILNTITISDLIYNAANWNANPDAATKNVIRDKIEAMITLIGANCTVAEVEVVITAELVEGQSIDNAIDALVRTNLNQLATRNHVDLQNKNAEANVKHLTDAQVGALHNIYTLEVHDNTKHNPNYSAEGHTHVEANITDLSHDATKILTKEFTEGGDDLVDADIMVYRTATGKWELEEKPAAGANPALNEVTDVTITDPADNEILAYDNATSEWINQTPTEANLYTQAEVDAQILAKQQSIPINLSHPAGGALYSNFGTQPLINLPAADNNCYADYQGYMPIGWTPMVNPTLVILYACTIGDVWQITVKADAGGEGEIGTTNNLKNQSLAFLANVGNEWFKKEVVLSGTISPGDVIGVKLTKTSVDTHNCYLVTVLWIKR